MVTVIFNIALQKVHLLQHLKIFR